MANFTPQEDITRSGVVAKTLATVGDTLIINTNGDNACAVDLSGTFTGANLSFAASWDNQKTWKGVPGTPVTTGAFAAGSSTGVIATPSTWNVIAQGATHVRVTLDALSTGAVLAQDIPFYLALGGGANPILTDAAGRQLVVLPGTTGTDYSANKPSIPLLGAAFASGPYAGYVCIATVPANTSRNYLAVENTSGSQIAIVRDDGVQSGSAPLTNTSVFSLAGGAGAGAQGGSWASSTFRGRIQVYALASSAIVSVMAD